MINIDEKLLDELGFSGMSNEDKKSLLSHIYSELELRVGTVITEQLSPEQIAEFEQIMEENDDQRALKWLEDNYPNYKEVVSGEFEKLKQELKEKAKQLEE